MAGLWAASLLALCAAAGAASAQEPLEEIVVTAQFREQNLQTTPISISAVTGDMLERRSIDNIVEISQAVPNVTMRTGSPGGGMGTAGRSTQVFIRGLGQSDYTLAYSPRVSIYVDDVYHATVFGSTFDLLDIDRIEVLRGPQGTLFGRNAVGGAVRVFTREPEGDNSGYLEIQGGSENRHTIRGAFDVPVVEDRLALRMSVGYNKQDGYVDRYDFACLYPEQSGSLPQKVGTARERKGCKLGTLGGTEAFNLHTAAKWTISDRLRTTVHFEYIEDNSEASPDTLTAPVSYSARNPSTGQGLDGPNGLAYWLETAGAVYGLDQSAPFYPDDPYVSYAAFGNPGLGRSAYPDPDIAARYLALNLPGPPGAPPFVPGVVIGQAADDPGNGFDNPPVANLTLYSISNILDWDITDSVSLRSITAYREYKGAFGSSQVSMPIPLQEIYNEVDHEQFSEEVRVSGAAFGDRLDWTVGGFYLDTDDVNTGRIQLEGYMVGFQPYGVTYPFNQDQLNNEPSTLKNMSGFAHGIYHLTDRLNLTAGIRYSWEKKTYSFDRHHYFFVQSWFVGAPEDYTQATQSKEKKWTPKVALDYQLTDDVLVYTSFSTGFTSGGFNGRPFQPSDVFAFDTETVRAYEVGAKSEWFDRRLRLNGALFYTDFNNIQLQLSGCPSDPGSCRSTSPFYFDNGGNARIQGFELELEVNPVPGLLVNAALGYNDFDYTKLAPQANPTGSPFGLTLDSPQMGVPDWTANIGAQYEADLGGGAGMLVPRIDAVYQSATYFELPASNPYGTQEGYWLVNARLTWRAPDNAWSVSAAVTNVFDKLYYYSKTDNRESWGTALGNVGAPRQWTLSVRRNF